MRRNCLAGFDIRPLLLDLGITVLISCGSSDSDPQPHGSSSAELEDGVEHRLKPAIKRIRPQILRKTGIMETGVELSGSTSTDKSAHTILCLIFSISLPIRLVPATDTPLR